MIFRVYVEKKEDYAQEAESVLREIKDFLGIKDVNKVRIFQRYDVEGISEELFKTAVKTVFSEPPLDNVIYEPPQAGKGGFVLGVEYSPGQFDSRAEAAADCIQLISQEERPLVSCARIYVFEGDIYELDKEGIKRFLINPVDSQEASMDLKTTLRTPPPEPDFPRIISDFTGLDEFDLDLCIRKYNISMSPDDLLCCINYFKYEQRSPTITELRILDAYWSDHCRHSTFNTVILTDIGDFFENSDYKRDNLPIASVIETYSKYLELREKLGTADSPVTLMDVATIAARVLRKEGALEAWDKSPEENACSVKVDVIVGGKTEPWLLMFKNETHNHPTEIEPFGGAATCIGGAIRDPLSGRAYVYQAMRISGGGNPLAPVGETLPGKLPQRKIAMQAAAGFSSYGNQIGVATGIVEEVYHNGYRAKRLEAGAVVGAVPLSNVRREEPVAGDVVVVLGGRTGRDGCGGASGSSRAHDVHSTETCVAEVQKGSALIERKLQRLFRNPEAARLIKRCNDFGAGGAAVAIGELAPGVEIDLDAMPKKYDGLDATELAISESQERMAVVLSPEDAEKFCRLADSENLEAVIAARITETPRLVMRWRGRIVANIAREFLNSNGAKKYITVNCDHEGFIVKKDLKIGSDTLLNLYRSLVDINRCSRKGLACCFDSTIGAGTVLAPFGGLFQTTPEEVMAALIPAGEGSQTASGMAFGFYPDIANVNSYDGAYLAVLSSIAKLIASGFPLNSIYLSFQEYFGKPGLDGKRWEPPLFAMLGALQAQLDFGRAAIGGKDSMSGTFGDMDVPHTFISFALSFTHAQNVRGSAFSRISEFSRTPTKLLKSEGKFVLWIKPSNPKFLKSKGRVVLWVKPHYPLIDGKETLRPKPESFLKAAAFVEELLKRKTGDGSFLVSASRSVSGDFLAETIFKMCVGNETGFIFKDLKDKEIFQSAYGSFVIELNEGVQFSDVLDKAASCTDFSVINLGMTSPKFCFGNKNMKGPLSEISLAWESKLDGLYPYFRAPGKENDIIYALEKHKRPEFRFFRYIKSLVFQPKKSLDSWESALSTPRRRPKIARPRVIIPVFPGTNCETDTEAAFLQAGAQSEIVVLRTRTPSQISESALLLAKKIKNAQMLALPGGFSGADEPDGSAKLIAAFFRGGIVSEAVYNLLQKQDGLILGICNGFQALVKLGLVPYGCIREQTRYSPTLTFNSIGKHRSVLVRTRILSVMSPWFLCEKKWAVHTIPISCGEGRFVISGAEEKELSRNGQIAACYVSEDGGFLLDQTKNPTGGDFCIEAVTSPDGRILGKMGHSERRGRFLYQNIPQANSFQRIFEGGVKYFS
ncbi:MAG: phosphoribosylformylglycinamidine synthase [Spirochaetaceae bacterium]|jgi:phosphoribosylformylglycinamidine synthase|nr:phosphoribosylformylglycinamidine synthase [Spirochaetaceae bacterium]